MYICRPCCMEHMFRSSGIRSDCNSEMKHESERERVSVYPCFFCHCCHCSKHCNIDTSHNGLGKCDLRAYNNPCHRLDQRDNQFTITCTCVRNSDSYFQHSRPLPQLHFYWGAQEYCRFDYLHSIAKVMIHVNCLNYGRTLQFSPFWPIEITQICWHLLPLISYPIT